MKRFVIPIIILLHLLNNTVYAADVTLLDAGQPAPYAGFLFSRTEADKVRNLKLDLDLSTKMVDLGKQENVLLTNQLDKANLHINNLADQVVKEKDTFWSNLGFFLLGSAVTTVIAYGVVRVTK